MPNANRSTVLLTVYHEQMCTLKYFTVPLPAPFSCYRVTGVKRCGVIAVCCVPLEPWNRGRHRVVRRRRFVPASENTRCTQRQHFDQRERMCRQLTKSNCRSQSSLTSSDSLCVENRSTFAPAMTFSFKSLVLTATRQATPTSTFHYIYR